jgi:hypothetical protein
MKEKLTREETEVVEDILKRTRSELLDNKMRIVTIKVERLDEGSMSILGNVKMYMEQNTERTENKRDVIPTTELWECYTVWNRKRNEQMYPEMKKSERDKIRQVITPNEMGRNLISLEYENGIGKVEGKTARGYIKLKYKDSADKSISVKEFMEKYTERTNSLKDRIAISKLLPKFYEENIERYGTESFSKKLNKYDYYTKPAKETRKEMDRYGVVKYKKIGEAVQCVMKITLKEEFYRNNNEAWGVI